jgi:hypothetical protein
MVIYIYNPSYLGGGRKEDHGFEVSLREVGKIPTQKQNTNKRAGGVTQVTECLPSTLGPGFRAQYCKKINK